MNPKIYLETSVVSYLVSRPSKNVVTAGHQAITRDFWDTLGEFDVYISNMVIQEAGELKVSGTFFLASLTKCEAPQGSLAGGEIAHAKPTPPGDLAVK